ncbi:MAG: 1-acyl-sn-glycerol-3-phosphate acyltransferase [Clostridia bacterium]|nr:1-acyl-sn-glycerol-3-phosphate acyltransferase [Clostridia bacterium]
MFRFYYTIVMRIPSIIRFVPKMRKYAKHPERYSDEDCLALCKVMIAKVAKTARTTTSYYGRENLPTDGGYVMFANHQGKYDALGVMWEHPHPCRVLMDANRAKMPLANEFVALVKGKRIEREDLRQKFRCITEIGDEIRDGKVYLIFPEGGYRKDQDNVMNPFHSGCMRSALRSERPIVPVALVDSYKPFGSKGIAPVHTQVHFLPPIPYEEYAHCSPAETAEMVRVRIAEKMEEVLGYSVSPKESKNAHTAS